MMRNFANTTLRMASAALLWIAATYAAPAVAQAPPTGHPCFVSIPGGAAWSGSSRLWGCSGIQAETRTSSFQVCPPFQRCFTVWVYELRARRVTPPFGSIGTAYVSVPGAPSCSFSPASTAWSEWRGCKHGANASPPASLDLFGLWLY
jgi:hypothetical protein